MRGRGRMIGEAYPGYMEQMEQQQFDTAWNPSSYLPEFNGSEYDVPHNAYLATDQVYGASAYQTSYPYRAPASSIRQFHHNPQGQCQVPCITPQGSCRSLVSISTKP
jgi:hypothetical protein